MTRSKVKLQLIPNESARRATFRKRKKGLLKKMDELTTLCGVEACAILTSPFESEPVVWPSNAGAHQVLTRFTNLPGEVQTKKMLDHEAYLKERVTKSQQLLEKLQRENREMEVTNLMYELLTGERNLEGLNLTDVNDLMPIVENTVGAIQERIEYLEKKASSSGSSSPDSSTDAAWI